MAVLPSTSEQVERLVELGVPALAGLGPEEFRAHGAGLPADGGLVVVSTRHSSRPAR